MMYNYGYPGYYGNMFGWGIGGILLSVLIWVLVVSIIITIVRRIVFGSRWRHDRWKHWQGMGGNSGMDVLNERYAKGEISKTEYEEKKKDILG